MLTCGGGVFGQPQRGGEVEEQVGEQRRQSFQDGWGLGLSGW
jgi:hypothetical protein